MKKVAILGNAAGGKSTLAHAIAKRFDIPYHELDALIWNEDWSWRSDEDFYTDYCRILEKDAWILDGLSTEQTTKQRLDLAETIILIDHPFDIHLKTMRKRHKDWQHLEIKPGNRKEPPPLDLSEDLMNYVAEEILPMVKRMVDEAEVVGKNVFRLSSFEEIDDFRSSYL